MRIASRKRLKSISVWLKAWWRISLANFTDVTPILVYQMGKVGSSSVTATLASAIRNTPVFQVHHLARQGLSEAVQQFRKNAGNIPLDEHLIYGLLLRRKITLGKATRFKVITLVRDPIARQLSFVFETCEKYDYGIRNAQGQIEVDRLQDLLRRRFAPDNETRWNPQCWFDAELRETFDVDVFESPFPFHEGFQVLHSLNHPVLVLRLEDINNAFGPAIQEFLELDTPPKLENANFSENKLHSEQYRAIRKSFRLPRDVCERIYATRYARHFYGDVRDQLIDKWSE